MYIYIILTYTVTHILAIANNTITMKTLVYGAGVIGSLYASVLKEHGKNVSILARGKRLEELREHGLIVENLLEKKMYTNEIDLVENRLSDQNNFDLILVIMQKNHVEAILPDLAKYSTNATIVILGNNGTGWEEYKEKMDPKRIILGFGGVAGKRDGHIMRTIFDSEKSNMIIGEASGEVTPRLEKIKEFLNSGGIPVKFSKDIDAWLKMHIALVSPLANAYFKSKSEKKTMTESDSLDLATKAIIEGARVLKKLKIPILPKKFRLVLFAPRLLKKKLIQMYNGKWFDIAMKGHADYAQKEMRRISDEFQLLVKKSGMKTPAISELHKYAPNE